MKTGTARISKKEWRDLGGLRNSNLFRKMLSGSWAYFRIL